MTKRCRSHTTTCVSGTPIPTKAPSQAPAQGRCRERHSRHQPIVSSLTSAMSRRGLHLQSADRRGRSWVRADRRPTHVDKEAVPQEQLDLPTASAPTRSTVEATVAPPQKAKSKHKTVTVFHSETTISVHRPVSHSA